MRKRLQGPPLSGRVSVVVTDIEVGGLSLSVMVTRPSLLRALRLLAYGKTHPDRPAADALCTHQGFSEMMLAHPELTMAALMLHNDIIHKARWDHFGFVVGREGGEVAVRSLVAPLSRGPLLSHSYFPPVPDADSFTLMFCDPGDAVNFCTQAQRLLAAASWPPGLFEDCRSSWEASARASPTGDSRGEISPRQSPSGGYLSLPGASGSAAGVGPCSRTTSPACHIDESFFKHPPPMAVLKGWWFKM